MSVLAVALIGCAVLVVIGAEWPRLRERLGLGERERPQERRRGRGRAHLRVIQPEPDDFAESVRRDLDQLPLIEEHDDRPR